MWRSRREPYAEYPAKGRGTGGVRCHRFLRGEDVLTLAWAAAATKRVRLGTSVIVLPMHHPVPIAKQLATLQTLSNGRVIFGIGVGWLEAEFSAFGVPFRERGRRTDESIALLRALWSQDPVTFKPRYW